MAVKLAGLRQVSIDSPQQSLGQSTSLFSKSSKLVVKCTEHEAGEKVLDS